MKEATNKLQKLRFRLQLSTSEDQRGPILELQNTVRCCDVVFLGGWGRGEVEGVHMIFLVYLKNILLP